MIQIIIIIKKRRDFFFEKVNQIDKRLVTLPKGHRDSTQINKIRNENGEVKRVTEEIKKKVTSALSTKTYTQQNWRI
jgi:hypothetical protein